MVASVVDEQVAVGRTCILVEEIVGGLSSHDLGMRVGVGHNHSGSCYLSVGRSSVSPNIHVEWMASIIHCIGNHLYRTGGNCGHHSWIHTS